MAKDPARAELRFKSVHRAPAEYVPPKGVTHADVPGLVDAELVDDVRTRSKLLLGTWRSREAFDAGAAKLLHEFGAQLTGESSGYAVVLEPPQRWWRRVWNFFQLSSNRFLAVLAGVVSLIAASNSVRDSYGAFFSAPNGTFRDPALGDDDPKRTPRNVVVGDGAVLEFVVKNTSMTRGNQLVARVTRLESADDHASLLGKLVLDPETGGHLPLITGAQHVFRATARPTARELPRPTLCLVHAAAQMKAGEWRGREELEADTAVWVWPSYAHEILGPIGPQPVDPDKALLVLEFHYGRATPIGVHQRVQLRSNAGFRVLTVRGEDIGKLWPLINDSDPVEWNVPSLPSFHTSRVTLVAERIANATPGASPLPWSELATRLLVNDRPLQGNPEPPP